VEKFRLTHAVCWSEETRLRPGKLRSDGPKASSKVSRAMHERKQGTLRSGRSGKRVKSRKQAIAIGLSEARQSGANVPPRKNKRSQNSMTKCPSNVSRAWPDTLEAETRLAEFESQWRRQLSFETS